jgi:hypothetical protein
MNSLELEIFDHLQGFNVENIKVDRNAVVHGEPAIQVTVQRSGYHPDTFGFRKSNKMNGDAMGKSIKTTLTKELNS